jgi:hypothetical protein
MSVKELIGWLRSATERRSIGNKGTLTGSCSSRRRNWLVQSNLTLSLNKKWQEAFGMLPMEVITVLVDYTCKMHDHIHSNPQFHFVVAGSCIMRVCVFSWLLLLN